MKKSLKEISGLLLQKWKANESINESQVEIFLRCILENFKESHKRMSSNYLKLSDSICELWHYREFEKLSKEQAFLYGSIWGSIKLLNMKVEDLQREKNIEFYIKKYIDKDLILKTIYYNPGIKHKDLAVKLKITPSQLSQKVHVFEKEGLITDDRIGREKYYYLLKDGEAVYKEIKSRKSMINLPLHERQWENNDLTNIIMRVTNNVEPILTVNPVINYTSHGIQNSFRIINCW